jgi:hypothetical protein
MEHCDICDGQCVETRQHCNKGERMICSLILGNYDVVMRRLYENPHLFMYKAGKWGRDVFRCAIFKIVNEQTGDYSFLEKLLEFGQTHLSPEKYENWLNLNTDSISIGVGTHYKYPIYKNDLKIICFLLQHGFPFPSNIILCCVSNTFGAKYRLSSTNDDYYEIKIKIMIEFLSRGANPNGCLAGHLISHDYLCFAFPIMIYDFNCMYSHYYKKILEILYIYGIEFDIGSKLLRRNYFNSDEEYEKYSIHATVDSDTSPLYWLKIGFYEIVNYNCENLSLDSNLVSNILYIFILYYSDKYDMNFISNELVNQYFEHQLKKEIYYFIIKFIPEEIDFEPTTIEMNYFITKIEKKMRLLMYLMCNVHLYSLIGHHFMVDYIESYI